MTEDAIDRVRARFEQLAWALDERMRRLFAAAEAAALGHGGVTRVARATGVSRRAIHAGLRELAALKPPPEPAAGRVRREGGGRKQTGDAALLAALRRLVEAGGPGPEAPLRWTCKSLRTLAAELTLAGHPASYPTVANLLRELGYSLQAPRKPAAGADHPQRDAQFAFINRQTRLLLAAGNPVLALETRKLEGGADDGVEDRPEPAGLHEAGAAPGACGDAPWRGVARDHETAAFAVESIRRWWQSMGRARYPGASELMVTTDGDGGSRRLRLWKRDLQRLADEIGLPIHISHLPPATHKWNKVEQRLVASVGMQWRGRAPVRHQVMISLIAGTITRKGLKAAAGAAGADEADEAGIETVHLVRSPFHGEWNYRIEPNRP